MFPRILAHHVGEKLSEGAEFLEKFDGAARFEPPMNANRKRIRHSIRLYSRSFVAVTRRKDVLNFPRSRLAAPSEAPCYRGPIEAKYVS